ncbi:MAG: ATP-dependent Clp protease proteolytic subunit [Thioalkalivibrio sp.]|nr:ATP-dependent Clp protease proteolytic subunit [Thioalkalivibrio sp.]
MLFDATLKETLTKQLSDLETHFDADCAFYFGEIHPYIIKLFRDFIEKLPGTEPRRDRLVLFLNTPGGSAEAVEKVVEIVRFHYKEFHVVVPDFAFSAGTILCMAADRIFMDYSSSLGPIDPQVFNGKEWVPALGYLDKVNEMLDKAKNNQLTNAEFLILQSLDLAQLRRYEQARDLTVTLLKKWLVEYKFRDWLIHQTDSVKKGQPVTDDEKQARAEEIARILGDNKIWHSHGRMIGPGTLTSVLRLKIDDYSRDTTLRPLVRTYNDLLTEYVAQRGYKLYMHSRNYF